MKRYFYYLKIIFMILSPSILAQVDDNETSTKGWANGRYWQILDENSKITYLYGIEAGVFLLSNELMNEEISESEWYRIKEQTVSLSISGFRFSDIVQQLDKFFEDRSNIRIPIAYAYYYSIKKMYGETPEALANYISTLRRTWNK